MNLTDSLLNPLLRADPMGPRITYYDDATGERIECSTVTLANWAAKTANLLRDELGAGPGTRVAVLLPAHWQTAAVLLGVWWIGAEVVLSGPSDVALCTSDRLDEADDAVAGGEVAVLSLDPFGKPAPDLPIGVTDYATSVRVHGDQGIIPHSNILLTIGAETLAKNAWRICGSCCSIFTTRCSISGLGWPWPAAFSAHNCWQDDDWYFWMTLSATLSMIGNCA